ncbi:MAG: hypothetical protein DMF72_04580 [Acidobacteria bacterium]|nr:MAG: hypothetical protein DMF72_04580 [Acidobacteriota bacterium]
MKIAIVSEWLPPSATGQGLLIYRMLEGIDPNRYCLISGVEYSPNDPDTGYAQRLPATYQKFTEGPRLTRGYRYGLTPIREFINFPLTVWDRARQISALVLREQCDAIVAFTGHASDLPAACLAAKRTRIPFYPYVLDHYSYREWRNRVTGFWARRLEGLVMKRATRVIVTNEVLSSDLHRRFGIEPKVIHNSIDLSGYEDASLDPEPLGAEIKIVFTGDVYEAHYDAFRSLLAGLQLLKRNDIRLHLYTPRTSAELADKGIAGPIVFHKPLAMEEMIRIQRDAHILFLPLAFNSPYPGLVKTSATTKMGEYMATQRPILVLAPSDSFVSWYFRTHDCGFVVDSCDAMSIAETIERVLGSRDLVQQVITRAWEQAHRDFDIKKAREQFWNLIARDRPVNPLAGVN